MTAAEDLNYFEVWVERYADVMPLLVSGVALLILFGPLLGDTLARFSLDVGFSTRGVILAQWFIATPFAALAG